MSEAELDVVLDTELPGRMQGGLGDVLFVAGACFHRTREVERVRLQLDRSAVDPEAQRMPRLDIDAVAPGGRGFRSGFWAFVPIPPAGENAVEHSLALEARLAGGGEAGAKLAAVAVEGRAGPQPPASDAAATEVAICMASFEPDIELFRRQIDSIRTQTLSSWTCLISDDCSPPERFEEMKGVLDGDARFVLSRSERRRGFYRNFERALGLVPAGARYVALADQDDCWRPHKLEALRAALGGAQLVYSDTSIIDAGGNVIADTYWTTRRNNYKNLASLLIANTVTGAASLFRSEMLEFALPFPHTPGLQYHDHWLALVALSLGEIRYLDSSLYDYVQHESAALGHRGANVTPADRRARAAALDQLGITGARRFVTGWRTSYFCEYCRLQVLARVLLMRCGRHLTPRKRRALRLFVSTERSPLAFLWLALRPLRRLAGRSETLGSERLLARGVLWRRLVTLSAVTPGRTPRFLSHDASLPPEASGRGG